MVILYTVVLTFEFVNCKHSNESYFPVILFTTLHNLVLTFETLDKILKCAYSNESYLAVLSCCDVYYALQGGSNF